MVGNDPLVFININEMGEPYDRHDTLDAAVAVLTRFPNDHIVVVFASVAARWRTE